MSIQLNAIIAQNEEPVLEGMFYEEFPFILKLDILCTLKSKLINSKEFLLVKHMESQIVNSILDETSSISLRASDSAELEHSFYYDSKPDDITLDSLEENADAVFSHYTKNIRDT
jgi:hypothetical protein